MVYAEVPSPGGTVPKPGSVMCAVCVVCFVLVVRRNVVVHLMVVCLMTMSTAATTPMTTHACRIYPKHRQRKLKQSAPQWHSFGTDTR